MTGIFGIDLAKQIADGFAQAAPLVPGTLIKLTQGPRTTGSLTSGPSVSETRFTFRGFLEQGQVRLPGTRSTVTGDFVSILGASVSPSAIPEVNDQVIIEGRQFELTELMVRDPAAALYMFRVQGGEVAS